MFKQTLVIARKEVIDHLRETRSLLASVMRLLMGPVVIALVQFSMKNKAAAVTGSMAAVFLLVSAFTGGMNVSMDMLAGDASGGPFCPCCSTPSRAFP